MAATCDGDGLMVVISSFAFKTGTPEANLVLDVRFLPDPRPLMEDIPSLHGVQDVVEEFLREQGCFDSFFEVLKDQAVSLITECRSRGSQRVHFAFGCVAGQHRSVFVAERLAAWMRQQLGEHCVHVYHRDQMQGVIGGPAVDMASLDTANLHELSSVSTSHSSSCSTSPSSSLTSSIGSLCSQGSSTGSFEMVDCYDIGCEGPCFRGTYHPDKNCLHFQDASCLAKSLSSQDMGSVLASGLEGVKSLRERRSNSFRLTVRGSKTDTTADRVSSFYGLSGSV